MPIVKISDAFKADADWISATVRAFVRDQTPLAVDTVQDVRDNDFEQARFLFIKDRGATYRLDLSSSAADNGDTVVRDSVGRRYLKIAGSGAGGAGLTPRGDWVITDEYSVGDLVLHEGNTFASLIDESIGNEPPSTQNGNAYWMYIPVVQGPIGPPGPGLTPAGEYEAGSTYALGDYVQFNGRTFSSLQAGNAGHQPPNADEDNAWWMWTPAAQGEPGDPVEFNVSPTHIQWRYVGDVAWTDLIALDDIAGEDGAAATVEVGTVATLNVGQSASVTNVGTSAAAVLDFAIPTGATGGVRYNFSTTTTDSDPGAGIVRFNHATFGSVTYVYFDNLALGSADVTAWLDSFDDNNMSGDKGYLLAQGATNPNVTRLFRVTGAVIDGTGYRKVPVAPIASGGAVSNSLPLAWSFYRTGDKGADGLGAGDMLKATYDPTSKNADAFARANHTGTQVAATISDFSTAADARVSAAVGSTAQAYSANLTSWAGITRASGFDTFAATPTSANLRALLSDEVGTGAAYFVGGALGTPASATLTNATGLPVSTGVSGLGTGVATFLATPSSANLRAALTDETGSGAAVFATSPTLTTPAITDPVITGTVNEDIYTISDGAGFAIDPRNGSIQIVTLGANRTPVASNFNNGDSITLMVADGTAYTITWTTVAVTWVGGTAPTLATSGYTVIELWKVGGVIYGARVGDVA